MSLGFSSMNDVVSKLNQIYGVAQKQGNPVTPSVLGYGFLGSDYAGSPAFQWAKVDSSGLVYVSATVTGNPNTNIAQVGGVATSMGQKLMASSWPVVIASDQSAIPVSQSGAWTVAATQSGTWNIGTVTTVTTLSQFPSTAALADATANPTLTQIQDFLMGFNATTWDRLKTANSTTLTSGVLSMGVYAQRAGGTVPTMDAVFSSIPNVDSISVTRDVALSTLSYLVGFDGTTWDRLRIQSSIFPNLRVGIFQGNTQNDIQAANIDALGASNALTVLDYLYGFNTATWDRLRTASLGDAGALTGILATTSYGLTSTTTADRLRTPNVFKTASITALGNTTVWTPANNKKFRLMGGFIQFSGDLAAAGTEVLLLQDGAGGTTIVRASAVLGTTLVSGETVTVMLDDMGNGFLSATANNVLNANLGTAIAAGEVTISVWGCEE